MGDAEGVRPLGSDGGEAKGSKKERKKDGWGERMEGKWKERKAERDSICHLTKFWTYAPAFV